MFAVPGNLWESHCCEFDPVCFMLLETYVSLLLVWARWRGVALHHFPLLLAVTRNIYNSLESALCYNVSMCARTPKPNGKSQILAGWGKNVLYRYFKCITGGVSLHTEVPDLKLFLTELWGFLLRCRNFAREDNVKQVRINEQQCVWYLTKQ